MWSTACSPLEGSGERGPINAGTGVETTVLQLAERIGRLSGRDDFEPELAPARTGEIERTVLDTKLAGRAHRLAGEAHDR